MLDLESEVNKRSGFNTRGGEGRGNILLLEFLPFSRSIDKTANICIFRIVCEKLMCGYDAGQKLT